MTERFKKAYDVLVKAFYEGTLKKGNCRYCTVGNLCQTSAWQYHFVTYNGRQGSFPWISEELEEFLGTSNLPKYTSRLSTKQRNLIEQKLKELYDRVGYSKEELAKIEFAFETHTEIDFVHYSKYSEKKVLEDQYNGLCAVVDVLLELDNIKPEQHYKQKFSEHPKLQLV